jgi:hypothetical protein
MKKILSILALTAEASIGYSQGSVIVNGSASAFSIYTNTAVSTYAGGSGSGTTSGKTATAASGFFYTVLVQTPTAANNNPFSTSWLTTGFTGVNQSVPPVAGGITGQGGSAGASAANWAAPTGASYNTGTENNYVIVGWSANLGSSWSAVLTDYANGAWTGIAGYSALNNYFFGVSALGEAYSGGGPNLLPAVNLMAGVTAGAPGGLTSGFSLYEVAPTPEPVSMALIGMGGASLLLFRRRNK